MSSSWCCWMSNQALIFQFHVKYNNWCQLQIIYFKTYLHTRYYEERSLVIYLLYIFWNFSTTQFDYVSNSILKVISLSDYYACYEAVVKKKPVSTSFLPWLFCEFSYGRLNFYRASKIYKQKQIAALSSAYSPRCVRNIKTWRSLERR